MEGMRVGVRNWVQWLLGLLAVAAIGVGVFVVSSYNRVVRLGEEATQAWAEVENQLTRRYDLIPNLVATVKGYAEHEKQVFDRVAEARTLYFKADNVADKVKAAGEVERALSRLLLLKEAYPQLKANENFMKLQDSLEGTENRIAVARTRFNEAVKELNAYVKSLFGRFFAGMAGVGEMAYFDIPSEQEEQMKKPPEVKF